MREITSERDTERERERETNEREREREKTSVEGDYLLRMFWYVRALYTLASSLASSTQPSSYPLHTCAVVLIGSLQYPGSHPQLTIQQLGNACDNGSLCALTVDERSDGETSLRLGCYSLGL